MDEDSVRYEGSDVINNNRYLNPTYEHCFYNVTLPCTVSFAKEPKRGKRKYRMQITEDISNGEKSEITVTCCGKEDFMQILALQHAACGQVESYKNDYSTKLGLMVEHNMTQALEILTELIEHSEHNTEILCEDLRERMIKLHAIIEPLERNNRVLEAERTSTGDHQPQGEETKISTCDHQPQDATTKISTCDHQPTVATRKISTFDHQQRGKTTMISTCDQQPRDATTKTSTCGQQPTGATRKIYTCDHQSLGSTSKISTIDHQPQGATMNPVQSISALEFACSLTSSSSEVFEVTDIDEIDQDFPFGSQDDCNKSFEDTAHSFTADEKGTDYDAKASEWKIDNEVWTNITDEAKAKNLLSQCKLPDGNLFQKVYTTFGCKSVIATDLCKSICCCIKSLSDDVAEVWPAYRFTDAFMEPKSEKVVFVVLLKGEQNERDHFKHIKYNIYQRQLGKCSDESREINKEDRKEGVIGKNHVEMLHCIKKNTQSLMKAHSNVTMISASLVKSIGFGTENAKIEHKACIVLYTHVKGLIPVSEKPFPTDIGGFPVDVREAVFNLLGGGPNDYHDHIKMGCAICSNEVDDKGNHALGTIGGFVDHPHYGLCCATSAHVIIPDLEKIPHIQDGLRKISVIEGQVPVYQPTCKGTRDFGSLVEAVYSEGSVFETGVDAALIKINSRLPINGDFPESNKYKENGFSTERPMQFRTGKLREKTEISDGSVIMKYGAGSEITRGVFRMGGSSIRTTNMIGKVNSFDFLLRSQLEIMSAGNTPFAVHGDSGALVFIKENDELIAIGVLEGDMGDGRYMVTPIYDYMRALGMPEGSTFKTFEMSESSPSSRSSFPRIPVAPSSLVLNQSWSDSGISINSPLSEDSVGLLSSMEERLKSSFANILTNFKAEITTEINRNIDEKLSDFKREFKMELQNT